MFPLRHETVVEHGASPSGRWLRARRLRIAAWIAVIEGVLVVFHVIPRVPALVIAGTIVIAYLLAGRQVRSDTARQVAWIAAASQAFVALIPVLLIFVGTLALLAVGVLAVVALVALFSDRG